MILVTGATGNVGGDVLRGLFERGLFELGVPVRAAVTDVARARTSLPTNADLIRFDFTDSSTFGPALEGVRRVFLMRPPIFGRDFKDLFTPQPLPKHEASASDSRNP